MDSPWTWRKANHINISISPYWLTKPPFLKPPHGYFYSYTYLKEKCLLKCAIGEQIGAGFFVLGGYKKIK